MSDTPKYDFAVFIGRFQPLHRGHEAIIRKAFEISNTPLILVGSSTASRSLRNPFSYEERYYMIHNACKEIVKDLGKGSVHAPSPIVQAVPDSAYNFHNWLIRVKKLIAISITMVKNPKIALLGHYKDDTSYYLNYFPEYDFIPVETQEGGVGATEIREEIFGHKHPGYLMKYCSTSVRSWILDEWMAAYPGQPNTPASEAYDSLMQEYNFIEMYKNRWATAPFPPTFVTTDAVVICLGHVLVIKRGRHPGKGQYALPGGFLEQMETIQYGCIRELKEETKIDVSKGILENSIHAQNVFDHPLRDPRGRTITHAFLFDLNLKELPSVEAADDASEVMWMPLQDVLMEKEDQFFNDHAQIIRYFVNRLR